MPLMARPREFRGVLQVAVPTDEIDKERQHLNRFFALDDAALGARAWLSELTLLPVARLDRYGN